MKIERITIEMANQTFTREEVERAIRTREILDYYNQRIMAGEDIDIPEISDEDRDNLQRYWNYEKAKLSIEDKKRME